MTYEALGRRSYGQTSQKLHLWNEMFWIQRPVSHISLSLYTGWPYSPQIKCPEAEIQLIIEYSFHDHVIIYVLKYLIIHCIYSEDVSLDYEFNNTFWCFDNSLATYHIAMDWYISLYHASI